MATVPYSDLPAGTCVFVWKDPASGWPARPTTRTDLAVIWKGPAPAPPIVTAPATGGMYNIADEHHLTP